MDNLAYLGQLAYFLTFVSYGIRNVTWLRVVAIFASAATVAYGFLAASTPPWIPIIWNVLFIAMNVGQLALTRWRSRAVSLDPMETFLSKTVLANFPPAEAKSFAGLAKVGELTAGSQLIAAGTELKFLFCVLEGKLDVFAGGQKRAEMSAGFFVGEMSLLTRGLTRADVVASTNVKLLVWPHEEIENWVNSDTARLAHLQTALSTQVVDQLLRQNEELVRKQQADMEAAG